MREVHDEELRASPLDIVSNLLYILEDESVASDLLYQYFLRDLLKESNIYPK
jgi:hypothetical protein